MKATLNAFLSLALLLLALPLLRAQTPSQVIIANAGDFGPGNKVEMAYWNLSSGNYVVFDSFAAGGVHSIFIWGRDAYICADSVLVRYNLDTYQREAMTTVSGVRRVAVWEDKVLVTRGFGAALDHFEVRNAADLSLDFSIPAIVGNCEGVVVLNDTGYVANPVGFQNTTGNIAVIDILNHGMSRIIDLDTMGKFIDNLYLYNGKVVSVNIVKFNNPEWGFISIYNPASGAVINHKVDLPLSQGAGIDNGHLYLGINGNIGSIDLATGLVADAVVVPGTWAASTVDSINDRIYVTNTDFLTYGNLYSYDYNGNRTDSLEIGVSPLAIAVDYNVTVGVKSPSQSPEPIIAFPLPFQDVLNLDLRSLPAPAQRIIIYDLLGEPMIDQRVSGNGILTLDLSELSPGAYMVQVRTRGDVFSQKVIKTGR